jgi:hypothetical protein
MLGNRLLVVSVVIVVGACSARGADTTTTSATEITTAPSTSVPEVTTVPSTKTTTTVAPVTRMWGQIPPGLEAVPFAPEVIGAVHAPHSSLAFESDGTGMYWTNLPEIGRWQLMHSEFDGTIISSPAAAPFAEEFHASGVALSPDGQRIFFGGSSPALGEEPALPRGIWMADLTATGWGEPQMVERTYDPNWIAVDPTVANSGNLYFVGITESDDVPRVYLSEFVDDRYLAPVPLVGPMDSQSTADPFIDPDERFLMYANFEPPDEYGNVDLFISYPQEDGSWSAGVNISPVLGQGSRGFLRFPFMSPDGRFLFFVGTQGRSFPTDDTRYFWVDANVLPPATE